MIEPASVRDLPEVRALLERLHLPLADVDEHLATMLVAREDERIVGTAALEMYADGALLRSVAVDPRRQGNQLGHQLTDAALRLADHVRQALGARGSVYEGPFRADGARVWRGARREVRT